MRLKVGKKLVLAAVGVMLAIGITGCGFSVGNSSGNESYKELFPDKAANLDKSYKTSELGYRFTLGDDGAEMMVHLDTSEGHSFEVMNEPAGFKVLDQAGNDALYAVCMDRKQYEKYSAVCDEVKTINGRDFLYTKNDDGSEDCYSYMADCGLDYGLVLEVHDGNTENFGLVAFRGKAIEGACSDVRYYQGEKEETDEDSALTDDEMTDDTSLEETEDENSGEVNLTNTTLSDEIQASLDSLQTDYAKIKWGAQYSISEELPGVVVSVTPTVQYDSQMLVVAVTNLYDKDMSFAGNAAAKDADGNVIGEGYLFKSCIGPGNTVIDFIDCGEAVPDGRISWTDVDITDAIGEYVPWEADYGAKGQLEDGCVNVIYSLYSSSGAEFRGDVVWVLLVDEEGFVVGCATDYVDDVAANEKYEGSVDVYGEENILSMTKDVAIFANPYVE